MKNSSQGFSLEGAVRRTFFRNRGLWRGLAPQLFLFAVLPLAVLVLMVAVVSQSLHHEAMRALVGDRDLRAVRAAAASLQQQLSFRAHLLQMAASSPATRENHGFDGGLALFSAAGEPEPTAPAWASLPAARDLAKRAGAFEPGSPALFADGADLGDLVLCAAPATGGGVVVGAFSAAAVSEEALGSLLDSDATTVMVATPSEETSDGRVLFRAGPEPNLWHGGAHPGFAEVLAGQSGIQYSHSSDGEHVLAYSPIPLTGWGLVIEEAWEDISNPYLGVTQYAPLLAAPVLAAALAALWFGARRIVQPLQQLEHQAARLASGDFNAIRPPVGGIQEIRALQDELIDMANRLQAAQESLHSYIGAVTNGIESERLNLARELHDDAIQSVIALNQRLQLALMNAGEQERPALMELQSLAQATIASLRRTVRGLRPIYLEDLGLASALKMLAGETAQTAGIPVHFKLRGEERRLSALVELTLYRMAQESLHNVARHAAANEAWLDATYQETGVLVEIRDDGRGFDLPRNPADLPARGHFGLLGLRERADIIGARLHIETAPGRGTAVRIWVRDENNTEPV